MYTHIDSPVSDCHELLIVCLSLQKIGALRKLDRYIVVRWLSFFHCIEGLIRLRQGVLATLTELNELELRDHFDRWTPVLMFMTDFGKYYKVLMTKMQTVKHPIIHKAGEWHFEFQQHFYQAFFSNARYEMPQSGPQPVTRKRVARRIFVTGDGRHRHGTLIEEYNRLY